MATCVKSDALLFFKTRCLNPHAGGLVLVFLGSLFSNLSLSECVRVNSELTEGFSVLMPVCLLPQGLGWIQVATLVI